MREVEKLFLAIAFITLVAVVLFRHTAPATAVASSPDLSVVDAPAGVAAGPSYLTYAQNWMFAPPVGNFLPQQIAPDAQVQTTNTVTAGPTPCSSC